jgi:hypothetical protein
MRQMPRASLGDRTCVCPHPDTTGVRWQSLFLMICLRCESFFVDDTKLWPQAGEYAPGQRGVSKLEST